MFRCTGRCSECGRCRNSAELKETGSIKEKMLVFPESFAPGQGSSGYGIAFDIGTTTVAGILWDLETGMQLAASAAANSQACFGADVISRIAYYSEAEGNPQRLRSAVLKSMNMLIDDMCAKAGLASDEITKGAVCGNTTMSHIFAGYSPRSLAMAPFHPTYEGSLNITGLSSGLKINRSARLTVLPNIAGHVGGDITAGIVASEILDMEGLTLFIDIGTNGEIVLTENGMGLACSTAAGPAFEGASISCGMRAAPGAIDSVKIEGGKVHVGIIGNTAGSALPACGICGSGLIDAIAQMLQAGLIDKSGRLAAADKQFVLTSSGSGHDVWISQKDIREVQLAKGAVMAGVKILLSHMKKTFQDIDRVVVAGAFGCCIDAGSAIRIGLLPEIDENRIIYAGNAAGAGASMALLDDEKMKLAEAVPSRIRHVELAEEAGFEKAYINSMNF